MAYKNKCGCGCGGGSNIVDITCVDTLPWDKVELLLGLNNCGKLTSVEKPEDEITEDDREKLDAIIITGNGALALFNDGTYKPVYTQEQVDSLIDKGLENVVVYDNDGIVRLRGDLQIPLNHEIAGINSRGNNYSLIKLLGDNIEVGDTAMTAILNSRVRPVIALPDGVTYRVAYQEDVEQLRADLNGIIDERLEPLEDRVTSVESQSTLNTNNISDLKAGYETLSEDVAQNTLSIIDLNNSTNAAFNTVNEELNNLSDRIDTNVQNIATNMSDIEQLREDLANQENFKGYFETTAEITAIPNPTPGDYAWNVQTGTVWLYNGTTWLDTTTPIPDQSVDAYDSDPLMDGTADPGVTNRYSRGDHRHPSDTSKMDISERDNFLKLTGNTQTTRITGDVWLSSGVNLHVTNSGNSYLRQNTETNTTELSGNGVGGINLISGNGTVKANGEQVVTYDGNNDIQAKNNICLGNDKKLLGYGSDGTAHNLIEKSRFGIIDTGSTKVPFNISSSIRPTAQIGDETGAEAHQIAFVDDVNTLKEDVDDAINSLDVTVSEIRTDVDGNSSDIDSILSRLAEEENFRGYKLTTSDVTSITNPQNGNYAYNIQTGTIWIYNGTTWADSEEDIPDGAISAYDGLPLMDGNANPGESNLYARGDHRHPSDDTKAEAIDLVATNNRLNLTATELEALVDATDSMFNTVNAAVAANTGNISTLQTKITTVEGDVSALQSQSTQIGNNVNDLTTNLADVTGRVGVNENDIATLFQNVNNVERFKGYYLANADITQLQATQGDFAWSAESGTIWIYDESIPSWTDSGDPIPDSAIVLSGNLPLTNGEAAPGESTEVSRWDHIHPSDPTKANVEDVPVNISELNNDSGYISASDVAENYVPISTYDALLTRVAALEAILNGVSGFWSGTQAEYDAIAAKEPNTYYHIYE